MTKRSEITEDIHKVDIRDRLKNAAGCGNLTGHLFELAVAEIDRLRLEIESFKSQERQP